MAGRHVVDMHDIEARVDEGRHFTGGGVQHQPARRRRFDVARTDRRRWIDDDHGHAVPRRIPSDFFRKVLRSLVMTDHVAEVRHRIFISRRAVCRNADGGDAARVNDALDTSHARGSQDIAGTFDVRAVKGLWISGSKSVIRGDVKQCGATRERALQGS